MPRKSRLNPARKEQLTPPKSLEQWAKDEKLRSELTSVLLNPAMVEAIRTLEESYSPSVPSAITTDAATGPIAAADLNNLLALRHVHRAGFYGFLNALRNLTRERVLKRYEKAPWGDLVPES